MPKLNVLNQVVNLNQAVSSVGKRHNELKVDIQAVLRGIAYDYAETGNIEPLRALCVDHMSNGKVGKAFKMYRSGLTIKDYMLFVLPINWDEEQLKFTKAKAKFKNTDWNEVEDNLNIMYDEWENPNDVEKPAFDLDKLLQIMVKKARKEDSTNFEVIKAFNKALGVELTLEQEGEEVEVEEVQNEVELALAA